MITRRSVLVQIFMLLASNVIFLNSCFKIKRKEIRSLEGYRDEISAISEIIIPKTDTPGAKEAGVSTYIISVVRSCLSDRDKKIFLLGLSDVDEYSRKKYSLSFVKCSKENRITTLTYFQNKGTFENRFLNKVKNKILGPSFFELIKNLVVQGYCNSKVGANYGLAYDHIPVNYIACIPLGQYQRSWATA